MRLYPELTKKEYEQLSDKFLLLVKSLRKHKKKFTKNQLSELNHLSKEMANILFLNADGGEKLKQWRIERLEKTLFAEEAEQ
jgi:hypothetical protein